MDEPAQFIFYPLPFPSFNASASISDGLLYLYGWKEGTTTFIAGGIYASSFDVVQTIVIEARKRLLGTAGEELKVLGVAVIKGREQNGVIESKGKGKGKQVEIELELEINAGGVPSLVSNHKSASIIERRTIILFKIPSKSRLQFLSLVPLQLDLNSFISAADFHHKDSVQKPVLKHKSEDTVLGDKLRQSAKLDFSSPTNAIRAEMANLKRVIDWVNLSPHLLPMLSPPPHSSLDPSQLFRALRLLFDSLNPPARLLGGLARAALAVSNWEIPMLGGNALKDLSATVQQADARISQALSWPNQYSLIRHTLDNSLQSSDMASLTIGRAHYIQFYNTLWLIANDMIVGSAFTTFFCENSEYLGTRLGEIVQEYTLTSLKEILLWLNHWPGGVKLNFELASVFCDAFLWGTGLWEDYIFAFLLPHLPKFVYALGLSGFLGTTMFISFASDLLSLLTLHIFVFYLMATSVFSWHLSMLGALFNIFRGKKYNVLRKRVEPAIYEVDQLLLGTILFTLSAFLFPTVLAYYLAFAASRLGIVLLHAIMETMLAFMNHFPLFAVMLRLKDPARLPGGVQFQLLKLRSGVPYLKMTNNPLHLVGIFFQHLQLSRRLASHYSPLYLLGRLLSGELISPIPRVRLRLWVQLDFLDKKKE